MTRHAYDVNATEADAPAVILFGKIAAAAIEVDRIRERKAMVLKARQRQRCIHEGKRGRMSSDQPCWRQGKPVGDDSKRLPHEEWCNGCRRRQAAHNLYVHLGRDLGGARGRLTYHVRRYRREYGDS